MLNVTVNNRFGFHQRIMLMIMLVLLQFYSIGSDFFPENITTTSMEIVDKEAPDVLLDFDDNASLRSTEFRFVLFLSDLVELTCFLLSRMG